MSTTTNNRNDSPRLQQRHWITQARALLQPSEVKPGMPAWFRFACLRALKPRGTSRGAIESHLREMFRGGWLDHTGRGIYRGRDAYIAEPYEISAAAVQEIATLARAIGCEWEIDANSWHYPANTLRVAFFEKGDS